MIVLTAKNLGERQRELNHKVIETASSNVDFDQLKDAAEENDIDRLFKIDVASKCKNVDYIIQVLKSGDPLLISRALKCDWLFSDDFSHVMNVDYLHNKVFPFTSNKMKNKLLSTLAVHLGNESRAAAFYTYCWYIKLNNIAFKFLLKTSESFKLEWLAKDSNVSGKIVSIENWIEYSKHFIKNSFELADAFMAQLTGMTKQIAYGLRYLYSVSNEKYLDLIEKHDETSRRYFERFGLRLSKNIVTKHKQRVINKISFYVRVLNKNVLVKHSSTEDAKAYAIALLPESCLNFWDYEYGRDFYSIYKFIFDIIPYEERFDFLKKIFNEKYPNEPFETTLKFYNANYYNLMTPEARESWALHHIASGWEILGAGNDYIWYKFVHFDKAFVEIKKLIKLTPDQTKRLQMLKGLGEAAKNQRDLEKLFDYFYDRHINEQPYVKENFIDEILHKHNVFEFEENCWTAFNKLLYSLEVYSVTGYHNSKIEYRTVALVYHIIKKKELPEAILNYVDTCLNIYSLRTHYSDKLTKEQDELVFKYLFNFYITKLETINNTKTDGDNINHVVKKYIYYILDLLEKYKKTKEDCPEFVMELMKLAWDEFKYHSFLRKDNDQRPKPVTQYTYIRYLKKDATVVVDKIPEFTNNFANFNSTVLFRKLKVYYSNDPTDKFIESFKEVLANNDIDKNVARAAVYGIFLLANESFKEEFMQKYAPTQPKIDHTNIDQKLLYIQQAICALARVSRPPVPLKNLHLYIKGDYVHYCLSTFDSYLAHLPPALCMEFIISTIDAPLSIQKHGLRLAFECFNIDDLVKLVTAAWKRTKNVSLRMILYTAVFNKILKIEKQNKIQLYVALKEFTLDLHEDDDQEVFRLLTSDRLPDYILGDYIDSAWKTVAKLPEKIMNLRRVHDVIRSMDRNMHLIDQEIIKAITEEHIKTCFDENITKKEDTEKTVNHEKCVAIDSITRAKWLLVTKYMTSIHCEEDFNDKLETTRFITDKYIQKWYEVHDGETSSRKLCLQFITDIDEQGYENTETWYEYVNVLHETILEMLQNAFPIEEIYMLTWKLNLITLARKSIATTKLKIRMKLDSDSIESLLWDAGIDFAKEFGILIQQYIEKDLYFMTYQQKIENKLIGIIDRVINGLDDFKVEPDDFRTAVSYGLFKTRMPQAKIYALHVVPLKYDGQYREKYKQMREEIQEIDDKEFRCNMYETFNMDVVKDLYE